MTVPIVVALVRGQREVGLVLDYEHENRRTNAFQIYGTLGIENEIRLVFFESYDDISYEHAMQMLEDWSM